MSSHDIVDAAAVLLGDRARRQEPIAPYTTYRVGGPAALFLTVETAADLDLLALVASETDIDILVVGNGSNLLVCDAGFPGLAVHLGGEFADIDVDGTIVRAGAAALLPVVARRTASAGLTGFEWAVGVPGSVGGAVRMNAGGHGSDMAETLVGVRVMDLRTGKDGEVPAADLDLGYRRSAIGTRDLVLGATIGLRRGDRAAAEAEVSEIVRWRRANQPGGQNAGSVFTNPAGDSAGRLVEAAGAKGRRHGSAQVSSKHANFIQSDADGSADDVFALDGRGARRGGGPRRRASAPRNRPRRLRLLRVRMTAPTAPETQRVVVDPRFRERRIAVRKQAGRRRLRRLGLLVAVAAVALATVIVLRSPVLDVDRVTVHGARFTSVEAVDAASHIRIGAPLLLADLGRAERSIEALPWVADARVRRDLPGEVVVTVTERSPAALLTVGTATVLVDDDGEVVGSGDPASLPASVPTDPPFVSVLAPGDGAPPAVGQPVDRSLRDAVSLARRLRTNPAGAVADVRVEPSLRLDLRAGGAVELGDATDLDAKIEAFRTVHARVDLTCLDTIDLRVPSRPVLTRRPQCS